MGSPNHKPVRKVGYLAGGITVVAVLFVALPIVALLAKAPWSTFADHLGGKEGLAAFVLSAWTSALVVILCAVLGIPLAWSLARSNMKWVQWFRPLVLSPIVLPPSVAGLALLALFGPRGIIGSFMKEHFGITIPFSTAAVVLAELFVALPFFVLIVDSTFRSLPKDVEEQAMSLGARPGVMLRRIAIPQSWSGIGTGALLAWARALGEFGATMMFAGMTPLKTLTLPMAVYLFLDSDVQTAYAVSAVMVLISVLVVFVLRKRIAQSFAR